MILKFNSKYILVLLLYASSLAVLSGACKNRNSVAPANIIGKQKMISILSEINIVEGALRTNQPKDKRDSLQTRAYFDEIFRKYNTTPEQFDSSIRYYSLNSQKFGEIYDEVITRLSKMQTEESSKK